MKLLIYVMLLICFLTNLNFGQDYEWRTIASFSGSSNTNTDDIVIKAKKWRLVWQAKKQYQEAYGGNFIVILHDENDDKDLLVNTMPNDYGQTIVRKKGVFYLEVQSVIVNWTIEVQEYSKVLPPK